MSIQWIMTQYITNTCEYGHLDFDSFFESENDVIWKHDLPTFVTNADGSTTENFCFKLNLSGKPIQFGQLIPGQNFWILW